MTYGPVLPVDLLNDAQAGCHGRLWASRRGRSWIGASRWVAQTGSWSLSGAAITSGWGWLSEVAGSASATCGTRG